MVVLGLTGGVASGKSFVASCLENLGAYRIDADRVAHEVLRDGRIVDQITGLWGSDLLDQTGQIDRGRLSKTVFSNTGDGNLNRLEAIVHPEIRSRIQREVDRVRVSSESDMLVLDIPLLFEGDYQQQCDHIIFVDANLSVRQQRAKLRGWQDDELAKRESRQLSIEEKKLRADIVIDNSNSKASTVSQLADFLKTIGWNETCLLRALHLKLDEETETTTD